MIECKIKNIVIEDKTFGELKAEVDYKFELNYYTIYDDHAIINVKKFPQDFSDKIIFLLTGKDERMKFYMTIDNSIYLYNCKSTAIEVINKDYPGSFTFRIDYERKV